MPKKVIVSGHILEIYEYERVPALPGENKNDDYDPFDFENVAIHREDRIEERKKQTLRDGRNLTRRLALMNFGEKDKFITLTFDPKRASSEEDLRNLDYVDKEFKKFIQRFNYRFKTKLKYIAVREQHKTGRLHLHMICDWEHDFATEVEIREFERFLGEKVWKHGFVDIKQIDHVDNVGAYLIKYMTKNLAVELFKGKKVYLCSKGLKRPIEFHDYHADLIIAEYDLETKKEVFTNSYISEYRGKTTYKEFNLLRL